MSAGGKGFDPGVSGQFAKALDAGSGRWREAGPRTAVAGLLISIRGVLYDASAWRRWLLRLVSRMGLQTHYTCFFRVWERDCLGGVDENRPDYWETLRSYLMSAGLSPGQIDEVVAAGYAQRRHLEENIRPFPGVKAALAQLAVRRVHLAASSNIGCTAEQLAEQLRKLGLAERFHTVIPSLNSTAAPLSHADRFRSALAAMQLRTSQVALVSCSSHELAAAAELGLQTVAFNYDGDAQADVRIEQFDQLLDMPAYRSIELLAG